MDKAYVEFQSLNAKAVKDQRMNVHAEFWQNKLALELLDKLLLSRKGIMLLNLNFSPNICSNDQ